MRIRAGETVIDTDRRQVLRGGREVALSPKAYQLLLLLLESRPKAMAKDTLYQALWPDTFVVEANLPNLIAEIRAALGDRTVDGGGRTARSEVIRSVHGFGYAFSANAEVVQDLPAAAADAIRGYLLLGNGEALALRAKDSIVGRGPEVQVRLDLPGISRRHARIVFGETGATIEDLDSKNGTFVGAEPVNAPRLLKGGDEVSFGSVRVTFHLAGSDGSTETTGRPSRGAS
jgi:DNA-binding winged helix-turn-helix (wHTH) protein